MTRCISCDSQIPDTSRFCLACGKPVTNNSETAVMPMGSTPISGGGPSRAGAVPARVSSSEGGFAPGVMVDGRYQIIGLLGKGGMGEVYRANDLTLDQPVALKFLPASMSRDAGMLARFHNEVRIARQVSHPNVCRVYDLGELDGQPYLSMEYIDGEDLGSLLHRIGRLPSDKALEFARRICAGLAAAHDKGVLHRDLKPSNIMIDSQGRVFITDFGLAAVTGELREAQAREGTPAYMAPEQLAGTEVTIRSDIYSLGLVLYEMFAGKRPFEAGTLAEMIRLQQESSPALTTVVKDVDPVVERVIQRCLAADPRQRPATALAVAAALPGGDPLAAALAAGETPSPDLVAAAGQAVGIRPMLALACLAATIAGLVAVMLIGPRVQLIGRVAMDHSPEVLVEKSRDLARSLGYTAKPMGVGHGFQYDQDYLKYVGDDPSPARWLHRLGNMQPPAIAFWYRESPRPLEPEAFGLGTVDPEDPAPIISGMVSVTLDPQGRLVEFNAVPAQVDKSSAEVAPPDWKRLFDAAGLDLSQFAAAAPQWTPLGICDARAAWTGVLSSGPSNPVRVEAAAWRGRPIYFQIVGPWTRPKRMETFMFGGSMKAVAIVALALSGLLLLAALLLARSNIRLGRGDRRGAMRLASFTACVFMLIWVFSGSHVSDFGELALFFGSLSYALLLAAAVWVLYVAIEPIARRRWPHSMISWNRLLAGSLRDPLVAHDVLLGLTFGTASALLAKLQQLVLQHLGAEPSVAVVPGGLLGVSGAVATYLTLIPNCVLQALVWFVLIFILRVLLRRDWLAGAALVVVYMILNGLLATASPWLSALFSAVETGLLIFVMLRFGLVSLIASSFVYVLMLMFPITADFSLWYAGASLFALLSVALMAIFAFQVSLAGRPLFDGGAG